jgi:hypothetical protein
VSAESQPHEQRPEESEQLPEEAPPEQVQGEDRERGSAPNRSGGESRDDDRTATGHPGSAGAGADPEGTRPGPEN